MKVKNRWLRLWRILGMLAVCLLWAVAVAQASQLPIVDSTQSLTQALPPQAANLLDGVDLVQAPQGAIGQIAHNIGVHVGQVWQASLGMVGKVLAIAVICGGLMSFDSLTDDNLPLVQMAGALAVTGALFHDLNSLLELCQATAVQLSTFSAVLLPVMATAMATAGAPATGATLQVIAMFTFDLLIRLLTQVLFPAVYVYLVVITLDTALGNGMLESMGKCMKWAISGTLKLAVTACITYLTLSGVMSGSVDAVAMKTTKFAVSGVVPVVGGILSDAAESVLAGAGLVRSTVGIFGILCVLALCILPFLKVGCNYLLFKVGAAVLSPLCGKSLGKLLEQIASCFGLLLGMLGTCALVLFLELVFFITMGHIV